jgi:hypothetical protein
MSSNQDTRQSLEGEAYQEKQFEDYLRMNPVEESSNELVEKTVADKFNELNGTNFDNDDYDRFLQFRKKYFFTVDDVFIYGQACHCCGNQPEDTCNEFCSDVCEQSYEETHNCFYENNDIACKMCIYNERRDSYNERNGGYGGNDGGYFGEDAEEQVEAVVEAVAEVESVLDDNKLYFSYSEEQREELALYAETHDLTIKEAIEYQSTCHSCGDYIERATFYAGNHQYCNERCWESCEEYRYPCFREANCKVCSLWQYHKMKNYSIYSEMYDSIDMSKYHESE